ncbi:MAG: OadG family protein [Flexilinea sp.]
MNAEIMSQALLITLIGMVILFISLFILWGVMELLVRIVKDPKQTEIVEEEPETISVSEAELKMRAAAAAVASLQDYDLKPQVAAAAASFALIRK